MKEKREKTGSQVFSELLRQFRKKHGFTGEKLEKLSGIDRTHISKIEHGVHSTDFVVVKRISDALNEPTLIKAYLGEFYPEIADYYEKINGPEFLTKTVLNDIRKGLSNEKILNYLCESKSIVESKLSSKKIIRLIHSLRMDHLKIEELSSSALQHLTKHKR